MHRQKLSQNKWVQADFWIIQRSDPHWRLTFFPNIRSVCVNVVMMRHWNQMLMIKSKQCYYQARNSKKNMNFKGEKNKQHGDEGPSPGRNSKIALQQTPTLHEEKNTGCCSLVSKAGMTTDVRAVLKCGSPGKYLLRILSRPLDLYFGPLRALKLRRLALNGPLCIIFICTKQSPHIKCLADSEWPIPQVFLLDHILDQEQLHVIIRSHRWKKSSCGSSVSARNLLVL